MVDFGFLRLVKFLKLLRTIRICRSVNVFIKLKVLVSTVVAGFLMMMWSMVL